MRVTSSLVRTSVALILAIVGGAAGAASTCTLERIDEWPVRLVRNRLIVDGTANGQKIAIMLGTGAQQSVMMRSAAERLNLNREWRKGFPLFGLGGESRAEVVTVNDLAIGRFNPKGWRFPIPIDQRLGDDFDVVLGEDFFSTVDVEFDLAHGAVRLFKPNAGCDGVSLAYWSPTGAGEVSMERILGARPQIILPVRLNGQPAQALLDTGATASVLARRDAGAVALTPDAPGVVASGKLTGIGEKSVDVWTGPLKTFAIADELISNVTIRFADLYQNVTYVVTGSHIPLTVSPEQPMLLGIDFLRTHRLLVAHSQQKVYLTYVSGTVFESRDLAPVSSAWVSGSLIGWRQ